MAPKRSAESKLAAGPLAKRPKVANQVPPSHDSDNLEEYDWLKINAYLNGDSELRREVDAAEHLEQSLNRNRPETFDFPVPRWCQEQEDQRYMMATNPFHEEGANEELAVPSGTAAWGLPDGTPDLDALDTEFAAHPIEHFFEENAQTIPLREVFAHPQDTLSVPANSTPPMDVLSPRQPEISQERSASTSSASHSHSVQMRLQQLQPIAPISTLSPCAQGTPISQTGQNTNHYLSQNVYGHPYQSTIPLANMAASQSTDKNASPPADQQANVTANPSSDLLFACSHCDKKFKLDRSKRRHERDIHERQPRERRSFACPLCTKAYTRNDALLTHGRKVHSVELPHQPRHPHNTQGL